MDENEKPRDEGAEEDTNHESAHEDETTTNEDISEEECDEAIAELLATISALESRIGSLEIQFASHSSEYEHRRVEPGPASTDEQPTERHWYFRHLRRG